MFQLSFFIGSLRPAIASDTSVQEHIGAAEKKSAYHDGDVTLRVSPPDFSEKEV